MFRKSSLSIWFLAIAMVFVCVPASMGNDIASASLTFVKKDIERVLSSRNASDRFHLMHDYIAECLSEADSRPEEWKITGLARLPWLESLYRDIAASPIHAEDFSERFHQAVIASPTSDLSEVLSLVRAKLGAPGRRQPIPVARPTSSREALRWIEYASCSAADHFEMALGPLGPSERESLENDLLPVLVEETHNGHMVQRYSDARHLCECLVKMDRTALFRAADALVFLASPSVLQQLPALEKYRRANLEHAGATGDLIGTKSTDAGLILVGGPGDNTYDFSKMPEVSVLIDLGGNDRYLEHQHAPRQTRVRVILDLSGDDQYRATGSGGQGGAVMGVSFLLDQSGNDSYHARDVAQGSALGGVGILMDLDGEDTYHGFRRVQGHALGGIGLLLDRGRGVDQYKAALWAQGFGGPVGFGGLDDEGGDDRYYLGGFYPDGFQETPGFDAWGQGVGAGLRRVANGGIGLLLDGGGDDVYEADYMSHGGGYWLGIGIARDFAGNDQRRGPTSMKYNGAPRTEASYNRFTNGFGCHFGIGFLLDDRGDDLYTGSSMSLGMGLDASIGVLCDFAGKDHYNGGESRTQGCGAEGAVGILFDNSSEDVYAGNRQGWAESSITYHDASQCGGNFSFLIDYGGNDRRGEGASNDRVLQRGANGGFLVDRPRSSD